MRNPSTMFGMPMLFTSMLRGDRTVDSYGGSDDPARSEGAKRFKHKKSRRKIAKPSRIANRKM